MTTAERLREAVRLEHCYDALARDCLKAADELEALIRERDRLRKALQQIKELPSAQFHIANVAEAALKGETK